MQPILILVDADACPVKDEVFRVAARYGVRTVVVSNAFMMLPKDPLIERVVVGSGLDVADDWIAERARPGVVVVTNDVPLAHRCVSAGAEAVAPNGKPFTSSSIGMALATRDLMADLRSAGAITGGPRPFSRADRSAFLQALDRAVMRLKRAGHPAEAGAPPG
jgi:uncharacterized protein YaiI (UPF0178 family)